MKTALIKILTPSILTCMSLALASCGKNEPATPSSPPPAQRQTPPANASLTHDVTTKNPRGGVVRFPDGKTRRFTDMSGAVKDRSGFFKSRLPEEFYFEWTAEPNARSKDWHQSLIPLSRITKFTVTGPGTGLLPDTRTFSLEVSFADGKRETFAAHYVSWDTIVQWSDAPVEELLDVYKCLLTHLGTTLTVEFDEQKE